MCASGLLYGAECGRCRPINFPGKPTFKRQPPIHTQWTGAHRARGREALEHGGELGAAGLVRREARTACIGALGEEGDVEGVLVSDLPPKNHYTSVTDERVKEEKRGGLGIAIDC